MLTVDNAQYVRLATIFFPLSHGYLEEEASFFKFFEEGQTF
jgi:hypothetical protein